MSIITKEVKEQIESDISIDRFNLINESSRTPILLSKYLILCIDEKKKLRKLKNKYYFLYKEKRLYYLGQSEDEVYKNNPLDKKVLRQDIDIWLNSDSELQKLNDLISDQESVIEFLEKIIKEIERRTFTIKNIQEIIKWESGG
jgi:hypothetical protein